jgi:hypothetical protein
MVASLRDGASATLDCALPRQTHWHLSGWTEDSGRLAGKTRLAILAPSLLGGHGARPFRYARRMEESRPKTRRSRVNDWYSSNKATNTIAIIALLAAVGLSSPVLSFFAARLADHPEADFISPNPSIKDVPAGFLVSVRSNNIPDSSNLFFVIRDESQAEWYPWAIMDSNETWSLKDVCAGTGMQTLQIWLVPDSQENALLYWIDNPHSSYTQGLTSLGSPSAIDLKYLTINVTKACPG